MTIWKDSLQFVTKIYKLAAELPDSEKFGLRSQIQRSAVSIPSNIAEGSAKSSQKEFIHFLNISLASSYELETQLLIIQNLYGFDTKDHIEELTSVQKKIGAFKKRIITSE